MGEFHRERSKAGRDGAQFRRVVAQLRETRASCHYARILPTVSCDDMTVPLCQVRQHHTELMLVNHYLQNETHACWWMMMYNIYLTALDINRQNTVHTFQQPHTFSAVLCLLSFRVTTVTLYSALEVTLLFMGLYKITDYFTFHYISDHSDRHSHNNKTGVICNNSPSLCLSLLTFVALACFFMAIKE